MFCIAQITVFLSVAVLLGYLTLVVDSFKVQEFNLRPKSKTSCCTACDAKKKTNMAARKLPIIYGYTRELPHLYLKIFREQANWYKANTVCIANGGLLAFPRNKEEKAAVQRVIKRAKLGKLPDYIHIGLYQKRCHKNNWMDFKGRPLNVHKHMKWAPGEPNNKGGHECCGNMHQNTNLNDVPCFSVRVFMCEIRAF